VIVVERMKGFHTIILIWHFLPSLEEGGGGYMRKRGDCGNGDKSLMAVVGGLERLPLVFILPTKQLSH